MKIVHLILILLNVCEIWTEKYFSKFYNPICNNLDSMAANIVKNLNTSYQIIIVLWKDTKAAKDQNTIVGYLTQRKSVTILKSSMLSTLRKEYLRREIAVYVVILHISNDMKQAEQFLTNLRYLNDLDPRPKVLLIYFHNNLWVNSFESITKYAWTLKYLDFTVIAVNINKRCPDPITYLFDPFRNISYNSRFEENLFPDKLMNGNGYRLSAIRSDIITMDKSGNLNSERIYSHAMISALSISLKKLNLSLAFSDLNYKAAIKKGVESNIYLKIKANGRMDFKRIYLYLTGDCEKYIAVVPILNESTKLSNFYSILVYISTFSIIIGLAPCAKIFFKNNNQFWNLFNILQQLMGVPTQVPPHNVGEKIFMLCFSIIGFSYSSSFYSSIVDMTLIRDVTPFDSFEKILNSRLEIYTDFPSLLPIFNYSIDASVKKIANTILLPDKRKGKCLKQLRLGRKIICIDSETNIKSYFRRHPECHAIMKITKPILCCLHLRYKFEMGSPYIMKLQILFDKIAESGIPKYHTIAKFQDRPVYNNQEEEIHIISTILLIILAVGYFLSFLTFLIEIITRNFQK